MANRPICAALAVTVDGERDMLGMWAGERGEGANYGPQVLSEIKNRGVSDLCIMVFEGQKSLPEAIAFTWPQTIPRTCIVHYAGLRIMPTRQ